MKKILVPTDFSDEANYALHAAAQIAKNHNCEIFTAHMLGLPQHTLGENVSPTDLPEALFHMKLAQKNFKEYLDKDYLSDIKVHETIDFNDVSEGIIENCKKNDIDLIVMGSHGTSGITEMFIGSNTEKVVRTSNLPVLAIKGELENFIVNDFVFASDFKNDNKETYTQAIKVARLFDAKIHLLHVNTPNNFTSTDIANERIAKFIEGNDFSNFTTTVYNAETVEKGILSFSREIDADLIGISTHGRQGIAHFFNGSISEDLVNHAKRPVITFKI